MLWEVIAQKKSPAHIAKQGDQSRADFLARVEMVVPRVNDSIEMTVLGRDGYSAEMVVWKSQVKNKLFKAGTQASSQ